MCKLIPCVFTLNLKSSYLIKLSYGIGVPIYDRMVKNISLKSNDVS